MAASLGYSSIECKLTSFRTTTEVFFSERGSKIFYGEVLWGGPYRQPCDWVYRSTDESKNRRCRQAQSRPESLFNGCLSTCREGSGRAMTRVNDVLRHCTLLRPACCAVSYASTSIYSRDRRSCGGRSNIRGLRVVRHRGGGRRDALYPLGDHASDGEIGHVE